MAWAFRTTFARADVMEVVNHRPVVSIGAHGWRGRWLVNGAHRPIAVIRLSRPVRGALIGLPAGGARDPRERRRPRRAARRAHS